MGVKEQRVQGSGSYFFGYFHMDVPGGIAFRNGRRPLVPRSAGGSRWVFLCESCGRPFPGRAHGAIVWCHEGYVALYSGPAVPAGLCSTHRCGGIDLSLPLERKADQSLSRSKVVRSGDLDVTGFPFNKMDVMAGRFKHCGIIGKTLAVFLHEGGFYLRKAEDLGGLDEHKRRTVGGTVLITLNETHGFFYRDCRNGVTRFFRFMETPVDQFWLHERTCS